MNADILASRGEGLKRAIRRVWASGQMDVSAEAERSHPHSQLRYFPPVSVWMIVP
jgi:hypothetical protein